MYYRAWKQPVGDSMIRIFGVAGVASLVAVSTFAQDSPEVGWGAAATTNYIYRGATQSDDKPAVQGYVEAESGLFYGGVWASTVDIDDDRVEVDLYVGLRPDFGDLSVDLSYTRFLYDESGDCCGEFGLALAYPAGTAGEVAGAIYGDPDSETLWAEAGGAVTFLDAYDASAGLGSDFGTLDYGKDKYAWNIGVSRGFADAATLDLRYQDSNLDPARAVMTLSLDF